MNIINFLLILFLVTLSFAEETSTFKFNYFGNLSATKLDSSGFNHNSYSHDSTDNKFSLTPYSKLGGQLLYNSNDLTFTLQGLVRKNHDSIKTDLTWFNVKYDINDDFAVRIGRIQTKVLLNSESLDIDYLHVWSKPPIEVYRLMPVRTFNGLELTYDTLVNDYSVNLSVVLFASNTLLINTSKNTEEDLDVDGSRSVAITVEKDALIYKASISRSNSNIDDSLFVESVVDGLEAYGNDMGRYTREDDRLGIVYSLGMSYRGEKLLFDTEIAHFDSNSLFPTTTGGYMMLGYKIEKFTPFVMYAEARSDKSYYDTSAIETSDERSTALKEHLDGILYLNNFSQKTSSLGMRYDLDTGIAFKAQVDYVKAINYGNIAPSTIALTGYERGGVLSRDAGTADKAVYMFTAGLSFAF